MSARAVGTINLNGTVTLDVTSVAVIPVYECELCARPARYQVGADRACSDHTGVLLDDLMARTPWDGWLPLTVKPIGGQR